MRRVTGLVLSALGAFLIVLALLTRFVVVGEVVKFPLNEDTVTTLSASNASYFSVSTLSEVTGAALTTTLTTQGDNANGNSGRAVWKEFTYVWDSTNRQTVNYDQQSLAFDRSTGELVKWSGNYVGSTKNPNVSGQGYVWPFNAQKRTYQVFNTSLMKPVPAVYSGTATVDGLNTYKYVQTVQPTQIGQQSVPGSLVGQSASTVTMPEYFQGTTTEFVDPITGAPVSVQTSQHEYLADSSGNSVLDLINATFATTPQTSASLVNTARSDDNKINLVEVILPLVIGLVGVLVLAIGLILALTGRRGEEEYEDQYDEGEYKPGEVPA